MLEFLSKNKIWTEIETKFRIKIISQLFRIELEPKP